PDPRVAAPGRGQPRLGGVLAGDREGGGLAPGTTFVGRGRDLYPLRPAVDGRPLEGEHQMAGAVRNDGRLAGVEVRPAAGGHARLADRYLRHDHVLPCRPVVPRDDRVMPDLTA